jgi:HK97 family phage major capsid protein
MPNMLARLHDERRMTLETVDRIADEAEAEDRDLSDSDRELISRHHARVAELDPQIDVLERQEQDRLAYLERVPVPPRRSPAIPPAGDGDGGDVYRTFAEYARDRLIVERNAIGALVGPQGRAAAEERISRVMANTLSSDVAGLIRPQYLDQIAQLIDKSRPIVQSARSVSLTSGKLSYPSITQKPQVGKQSAEKTESPSRTMTVAFVDVIAETYVGAGDLSWQAINWSTPDALSLWFDLAAEQYAWQTEAATGTVLAASTAQATPVIPASPVLADWIAAIMGASANIYAASRRYPDTIYADIASGYGIMGNVANVSPVFFAPGTFDLRTGQGNVGGLRLVISAGLPAKTVVVGASSALLVAETAGAPVELRAVEPAIGGMEVGIIGAFVSKITDGGAFRKLTIT